MTSDQIEIAPSTATVLSDTPSIVEGDLIEIDTGHGVETMAVRKVDGPTTLTIRKLRWWEKLGLWVRRTWRRFVRWLGIGEAT